MNPLFSPASIFFTDTLKPSPSNSVPEHCRWPHLLPLQVKWIQSGRISFCFLLHPSNKFIHSHTLSSFSLLHLRRPCVPTPGQGQCLHAATHLTEHGFNMINHMFLPYTFHHPSLWFRLLASLDCPPLPLFLIVLRSTIPASIFQLLLPLMADSGEEKSSRCLLDLVLEFF
jgi:hypothetical protein